MRIGVVTFPGSLDDGDAARAARIAGAEAIRLWHADPDLHGVDAVVLPGGFSYGDYLRCGAIARFAPVMESIKQAAAAGMPVLGICNGFQILCEAHLLPGALTRNQHLHFRNRDQLLRLTDTSSAWTGSYEDGQELLIPVKNGEGCYVADEKTLDWLEANGQVVARYIGGNPNGSMRDIAAIRNEAGNVVGIMPHPEHAVAALTGPSVDGLGFFTSVLKHLAGGGKASVTVAASSAREQAPVREQAQVAADPGIPPITAPIPEMPAAVTRQEIPPTSAPVPSMPAPVASVSRAEVPAPAVRPEVPTAGTRPDSAQAVSRAEVPAPAVRPEVPTAGTRPDSAQAVSQAVSQSVSQAVSHADVPAPAVRPEVPAAAARPEAPVAGPSRSEVPTEASPAEVPAAASIRPDVPVASTGSTASAVPAPANRAEIPVEAAASVPRPAPSWPEIPPPPPAEAERVAERKPSLLGLQDDPEEGVA